MFDRTEISQGDRIVIVGGPYPANLGKQLRVVAVHSQIWATPIDEDNTITYTTRYSNHMKSGPGEVVRLDRDHVQLVVLEAEDCVKVA